MTSKIKQNDKLTSITIKIKQATPEFDINNLVALVWANNECYTCVVDLSFVSEREVPGGEMGEEPYTWKWAKLVIDTKKGTWEHGDKKGKIGYSFTSYYDCRYGLIGIYDKTNIQHLNHMVSDAKEATEDRNIHWD
jgi:hypothetical protein